jgi:FKBP-type peptidyl-prolyl cis-trans isomerase FkpA
MSFKKTKYLILFCAPLLLLLFSSCNRKGFGKLTKGMSPYNKGEFWYSLYSDNPHADKPKVGDQVRIDYSMKKGEKVLIDSYGNRRPTLVQIPQPRYDNFFTKALRLMGEGDSIVVLIEAAEAGDLLGEFGTQFQEEDAVTFTYKMHEIKSAKVFEQEIRAEIERIDGIKEEVKQRVHAFSEGKLKDSIATTETGLGYLLHQKGNGRQAKVGDLVQVHYICYLPDGTALQDSYSNMTPMEFILGDNTVIDGWSQGIELLKEGASATLFIPPHLGYGEKGVGDIIPANSSLIFYVELLTVE